MKKERKINVIKMKILFVNKRYISWRRNAFQQYMVCCDDYD